MRNAFKILAALAVVAITANPAAAAPVSPEPNNTALQKRVADFPGAISTVANMLTKCCGLSLRAGEERESMATPLLLKHETAQAHGSDASHPVGDMPHEQEPGSGTWGSEIAASDESRALTKELEVKRNHELVQIMFLTNRQYRHKLGFEQAKSVIKAIEEHGYEPGEASQPENRAAEEAMDKDTRLKYETARMTIFRWYVVRDQLALDRAHRIIEAIDKNEPLPEDEFKRDFGPSEVLLTAGTDLENKFMTKFKAFLRGNELSTPSF